MIIPTAFASALGLPSEAFQFLRRSQNEVHAFEDSQGNPRILRLTAGSHRTLPELEDELDWVLHLHTSGLNACPPVPFPNGSLILSAPDGHEVMHGIVFASAQGRPLSREDLGSELNYLHGLHLGSLHASARRDVATRLSRRKPWDEERYFVSDIDLYLPEQDRGPLREVFQDLRHRLDRQVAAEDIGPVHLDLGYSNFHRRGDRLDLFDFDNCARGPFVLDIAAALYGAVFTLLRLEFPGDRSVFEHPKAGQNLERIWEPFAEGYRSGSGSLEAAPQALTVGLEIMYFRSVVHAYRIQHGKDNAGVRELLDADIRNLLNRTPPLRFDFVTR
jgi:Ser/Thr protein kinase RdoA (MazF antagonist)